MLDIFNNSKMDKLNFTQWHLHLQKQLEADYRKLKLIKNENIIQKVSRGQSPNLRRV